MKLTRDKVSEKYEERKSVFDERIPSGYQEGIFRDELSYPLTEYESVWRTSMFLKKVTLIILNDNGKHYSVK